MATVIRLSPTVTLRLTLRPIQPPTDGPDPGTAMIHRPIIRLRPRRVFDVVTNKGTAKQDLTPPVPPLAPDPDTHAPLEAPARPRGRALLPATCAPPGPFQLLRRVQPGSYGEAVVVREMGRGPGRALVMCMKVFEKKVVLKNNLLSALLREVLAYKRLSFGERAQGQAFVMDLQCAMQDEEKVFYAMVSLFLEGEMCAQIDLAG
jgi:hypothetical protein